MRTVSNKALIICGLVAGALLSVGSYFFLDQGAVSQLQFTFHNPLFYADVGAVLAAVAYFSLNTFPLLAAGLSWALAFLMFLITPLLGETMGWGFVAGGCWIFGASAVGGLLQWASKR